MSLEQKVDKILSILLGNGKVGLCEQVRDNADGLTEINDRHTEKDKEEKAKPDKLGKWVVRVFLASIAVGELFIAYLVYKGS